MSAACKTGFRRYLGKERDCWMEVGSRCVFLIEANGKDRCVEHGIV